MLYNTQVSTKELRLPIRAHAIQQKTKTLTYLNLYLT